VWDVASGGDEYDLVYSRHTDWVNSAAWSPDGLKIASASDDGKVRVWDVASGGDEYDLVYSRHTDWVNSAAWSPDGLKIASASDDGKVRVWDVTSGGDEVDLVYSRHAYYVNSAAWQPLCLPGTFNSQGVPIPEPCQDCNAGKYSGATGATSQSTCKDCSAGKYSSATGAMSNATCQDCGAGKYSSAAGATSDAICSDCNAGKYSSAAGATSEATCQDCVAGKYVDKIASLSCIPCQRGYYTNHTASSSCFECAQTFTTLNVGQKSESMCIKSPVWMTAVAGPCYLVLLSLYIFGRDFFLSLITTTTIKTSRKSFFPYEVPQFLKSFSKVVVGALLGLAVSIVGLWEFSTDSPHALIHSVGTVVGGILAWSALTEFFFKNISKILLCLDLASDGYVVYVNVISGNPDIVLLLVILMIGPYLILGASIAPMYPTIFDLEGGESLAIFTHLRPVVFKKLGRDTLAARCVLLFYSPILLIFADVALLIELIISLSLLIVPTSIWEERISKKMKARTNTSGKSQDHITKQAEQYSHLRTISESILESPFQLYVQLAMIRTGFEDKYVNFEFLVGSVIISLVNIIGNIYDLNTRSKELGVNISDYMRFIRRLDDGNSSFVRRFTVKKVTREATRGLEDVMRKIEMCNLRGGVETEEIEIDEGETSQLLKGEGKILMNHLEAQNGKAECISFKIWKKKEGAKHKKVTAILAFVETEEDGDVELKGKKEEAESGGETKGVAQTKIEADAERSLDNLAEKEMRGIQMQDIYLSKEEDGNTKDDSTLKATNKMSGMSKEHDKRARGEIGAAQRENFWKKVTQKGSGEVYYWNPLTGETAWEKPE